MNQINIIKSVIKVELFLSITLFILPVFLPVITGEFLDSVSKYIYSEACWFYIVTLSFISIFFILDGIIDKNRRFNIILGISMLGVVIFPVKEGEYIHDVFAILFFLENLFILIYFSKVFSKQTKISIFIIVLTTLTLLFLNVITLFLAESIGLFCVSIFFFIRFLKIN
tara:strand:+ start:4364 stop:4870 length:507 start_codon:yes stop_codon:yes gene_type:complete